MSSFIIIVHVIVCLALIMIVLLQTGKGADMGAAFGGGASQTLFGTTGASTFLTKATTAAAVIFMLTSLTLAYMSGPAGEARLVTEPPPAPAQTAPESAPAPEATEQAPAMESQTPEQTAPEAAPTAPPAAGEADPAETVNPSGAQEQTNP